MSDETIECENCGDMRYSWEACPHCDYVHWRDELE